MAQTGSWLSDLINDQHVVAVAMKCLYYNYVTNVQVCIIIMLMITECVAQTLTYFLNRFNQSFSVGHKLLYANNIICYVRTITRSLDLQELIFHM